VWAALCNLAMNSTNDKLDKLLRKERKKAILSWIGIIVPIAFLLLFLVMPPMGSQELITGEVVTLTASQSDDVSNLFIMVKIDTGPNVRVYIPNSSFYKKGKTVKLLKMSPKFFGRTVYKFRGYHEDT